MKRRRQGQTAASAKHKQTEHKSTEWVSTYLNFSTDDSRQELANAPKRDKTHTRGDKVKLVVGKEARKQERTKEMYRKCQCSHLQSFYTQHRGYILLLQDSNMRRIESFVLVIHDKHNGEARRVKAELLNVSFETDSIDVSKRELVLEVFGEITEVLQVLFRLFLVVGVRDRENRELSGSNDLR